MHNLILDKHQLILAKGCHVMTRRGYHGTGVQEIVAASGVPKGSFYHYFASKEDFALQALDFIYAPRLERYAQALANSDVPPAERIVTYYHDLVEHLQRLETGAYHCFIGTLSFEMGELSQPIGRRVEAILQRSVEVLATCLNEARACGQLSPDTDCQALAEFIANAWEGALLRMKVGATLRPLTVFLDQLNRLVKSQ